MVIAASIIVFFFNILIDFVYAFEFKNPQVSDLYTNDPFLLPFDENNYSITNDYSHTAIIQQICLQLLIKQPIFNP